MTTVLEGSAATPRLTPPPLLTLANPTSPREASPSPASLHSSIASSTSQQGLHPTLSPSAMAVAHHSLPLPPAHGAMFPFFKAEKPVYNCSPQAASCPENNNCRLIEFRGAKLAAFKVDGRELICLPQAFDLFLKHLVGGLHTVYTKLKRLDITPVVCNVEQVRVLRGLGAIQPGVNRCKLIAPKEFDILYDDCTNASSRPGRPPKRSALMSSPDTMEKLKKSRLDEQDFSGMSYPHSKLMEMKKTTLFNGYHAAGYPPQMTPLPFLPLGHPMMNFAMHHAASHLGGMRPTEHVMPPPPLPPPSNGLDLSSARHKERAEADSEKTSMPKPLNLEIQKMVNGQHQMDKESDGRPSMPHPSLMRHQSMDDDRRRPDLPHEDADDEEDDYDSYDDDDDTKVDDLNRHERALQPPTLNKAEEAPAPDDKMCASSSLETLLLNILGLLKVAAANARNWEHKMSSEKAELSMRAAHERELRDRYERQLQDERRVHEILEKKLKRERKVVKRLRHQIQVTEHAQSRSEHQSRERIVTNEGTQGYSMDVKRDDEEAPKLNRMRHEEINSDGEQSSCSSSDSPCSPRVADHWRPATQPAFPHPVVAPMTEVQTAHAPYDADTGSYLMTSSQKLSSDSPGNHSVSSA